MEKMDSPASNDDEFRLKSVLSSSSRVSRRDMVKHNIDFLNDDPSSMTFSRRAALYMMRRYSWYNPQITEQRPHSGEREDAYIEMDEMSSDGSFNRTMLQSPVHRERPSLEKAWAYFEHVTLPRYLDHKSAALGSSMTFEKISPENRQSDINTVVNMHFDHNNLQEELLDLAEPGDDSYPTKLYSPFWTPILDTHESNGRLWTRGWIVFQCT